MQTIIWNFTNICYNFFIASFVNIIVEYWMWGHTAKTLWCCYITFLWNIWPSMNCWNTFIHSLFERWIYIINFFFIFLRYCITEIYIIWMCSYGRFEYVCLKLILIVDVFITIDRFIKIIIVFAKLRMFQCLLNTILSVSIYIWISDCFWLLNSICISFCSFRIWSKLAIICNKYIWFSFSLSILYLFLE